MIGCFHTHRHGRVVKNIAWSAHVFQLPVLKLKYCRTLTGIERLRVAVQSMEFLKADQFDFMTQRNAYGSYFESMSKDYRTGSWNRYACSHSYAVD